MTAMSPRTGIAVWNSWDAAAEVFSRGRPRPFVAKSRSRSFIAALSIPRAELCAAKPRPRPPS